MKREIFDYITDIVEAMNDIESFLKGYNFKKFFLDRKTSNAVIRSLEVIGEAAKCIPDGIRAQYSKIPWKRMAGMRDKLAHHYFGVDLDIVWAVATEEIPPLSPYLTQMRKDFENEDIESPGD
jgi:uncharacterized protein with HEPN domain